VLVVVVVVLQEVSAAKIEMPAVIKVVFIMAYLSHRIWWVCHRLQENADLP